MTEEEKIAADAAAQALADAAKQGAGDDAPDYEAIIAEKDAKFNKVIEERDNYKAVALKRLGKLPGDADFLNSDVEGLSVAEQVKLALLDREVEKAQKEKDEENRKLVRENSELRLALKNRPGASLGSGEGTSGPEVKDNVFSASQIDELTKRATRLKADPVKFIEQAKKNFLARR